MEHTDRIEFAYPATLMFKADDRFQPRQHGLRVLRMQEGRSETAERIRPGDIPGQRVGDEVLRRAAAVGKSE